MEKQLNPHRGTAVLVMGILGLVICVIPGIFAWIWGNQDLAAMDSGLMDPEGRGLTQAGRICGMISVILNVVGLLLGGLMLLLMIGAGVAGS